MSSYAEERKAAIRARNAQSKRRARQMELRIAKLLKGRRVPMSGAGQIKGDCQVITDIGEIYIECKYSAGIDAKRGPMIRINFQWLDKMQRDVDIMGSRFGALIFRYHDTRLSDYVILDVSVFQKYAERATERLTGGVHIFETDDRSGLTLFKKYLDAAFVANPNKENLCLLNCKYGLYVLMTIDIFQEMIIHGSNDNQLTRTGSTSTSSPVSSTS